MYYPHHNVIFIAINKSGSSSVLKALNDALYNPDVDELWQLQPDNKVRQVHEYLKHAQAWCYRQVLGEETYSRCLVISQVRNPWDKMVSDFHFRSGTPRKQDLWDQQRKWFIQHGLLKATDSPPRGLFRDYVLALDSGDQVPHRHWLELGKRFELEDREKSHINQLDGLTDPDGNLIVNEVMRLEDLATSWPKLQQTIAAHTGQALGDLPHLNKSARTSYRDYYDSETREIVARLFARDIAHFGYTF